MQRVWQALNYNKKTHKYYYLIKTYSYEAVSSVWWESKSVPSNGGSKSETKWELVLSKRSVLPWTHERKRPCGGFLGTEGWLQWNPDGFALKEQLVRKTYTGKRKTCTSALTAPSLLTCPCNLNPELWDCSKRKKATGNQPWIKC